MKVELKRIGNSTGLILPKDLLARLGLKQGDEVFVSERGGGAFEVSRHDPHHAKAVEIGRDVMREYRDSFKELAK